MSEALKSGHLPPVRHQANPNSGHPELSIPVLLGFSNRIRGASLSTALYSSDGVSVESLMGSALSLCSAPSLAVGQRSGHFLCVASSGHLLSIQGAC